MKIDINSYTTSSEFMGIIWESKICYETYTELLNEGINLIDNREKKIELRRKKFIEQNNYSIEDSILEYDELINFHFSDFFYNSAAIYLLSQFEVFLLHICEKVKLISKKEDKIRGYAGKLRKKYKTNPTIIKYFDYIEHITEIEIEPLIKFQEIEDFNFIRNKITHYNNKINESDEKQILKIIEKWKNKVQYHEPSKSIIINKEFLIYFSDLFDKTINIITENIYNHLKIAK